MNRKNSNFMRVSLILTLLIINGIMLMSTSVLAAATPEGTIAIQDAGDDDNTVLWVDGYEPATFPYFDVNVMVTNVTDGYSATFSVHWNTSVLNLTSYTWGDAFLSPPKTPIQFIGEIDYAAGNMSDVAGGHMPPDANSVKDYADPNWGLLMTLTFEYLGAAPSELCAPIATDIMLVHNPSIQMPSQFFKLGGTPPDTPFAAMIHCNFRYEAAATVTHQVTVDAQTHDVVTVSNGVVSTPMLDTVAKQLAFNVSSDVCTVGFCNITMPLDLVENASAPWTVMVNGVNTTYTAVVNATHLSLFFTFNYASTLPVTIDGPFIPEFTTLTLLLVFLSITFIAIIVTKKPKSTNA